MMEAGFIFENSGKEFKTPIEKIVVALLELPEPIRPTHFSMEESIENTLDTVIDKRRFADFRIKNAAIGFFLIGKTVIYNIRNGSAQTLICDCFIGESFSSAPDLVLCMSKAQPIFGYVCSTEEYESKNRFKVQLGINKIESWVGRDTKKYVPGFYWITLLPNTLAKQHGIELAAVKAAAQEYVELEGGQHMFRFYEQPQDWRQSSSINELYASLAGVFNIEKIKPSLLLAKNYAELRSLLREYK
jgi:hypothetical protein